MLVMGSGCNSCCCSDCDGSGGDCSAVVAVVRARLLDLLFSWNFEKYGK